MPLTVVHASAGSGKTYALAMFFVRILLNRGPEGHPQDPAAILSTTFTRAAAGEILDRIIRLLAAAVLAEADRVKLAEHVKAAVSREDCARVLRSLAVALDRLGVSTMDAFFQQAARAFAAELGFAPDWQPAIDESADELDRATLRALLLRAEPESLANALWTYKQKTGSSIHHALVELSGTLDEIALPVADPGQFVRPVERTWADEELAPVRACLSDTASWMPKTKTGQLRMRWQTAVERLRAELQPGRAVIPLLGDSLARRILEGTEFDRVAIPAVLSEALFPALEIAKRALREHHDARLRGLAWLAHHYRHARDEAVFQTGAYTFGDVSRILSLHTLHNDDFYFRLGVKFEHVLFDEFQDTSRRQFEFFRPLVEEIGASGGEALVVGDEKQAIYGWRGGDRELMRGPLDELGRRIGSNPAPDLHRSFRSSPAILRAVNRTFNTLNGEWLPAGQDSDARIAEGRDWVSGFVDHEAAAIVQDLRGTVRMHEVPESGEEEDADGIYIERALSILGGHLAEDPERKVAILLRKNKLMPRIMAEIRRRFPGVDVSGEGGNPLTDSRAVEILLSLFTYLDHPGHTAARHLVLTSPVREVFGFASSTLPGAQPGPEESRLLRMLRRDLMNRGFAPILREWIKAVRFQEQCAAHDSLRCEQLIEIAHEFDRRGPARPAEFVAHVRSRRVERPGGSAVRVMSIHASKGLEFEAVILLEVDARKSHGGDAPVLEADGEWHVVPSKDNAALIELEHVRDARVRRDFGEELSVLYVGMTRARSFLDIVLREKDDSPVGTLLRTGLAAPAGEPAELHHGLSARECDARSGRGLTGAGPDDPGISEPAIRVEPVPAPMVRRARAVHVTPSSREDEGTVLVSRILAPANRSAMRRGELIHAWLARITWVEDGLPTAEELLSTTGALWAHLSKATATALAEEILAQVRDPSTELHQSLSRSDAGPGAGIELWTERRFAAVTSGVGGQELLTGTFDRVMIWPSADGRPGRAHVVDFKTDTFRDAADRQRVEELYRPQLDAYRRALSVLLPGLAAGDIRASLCFVV